MPNTIARHKGRIIRKHLWLFFALLLQARAFAQHDGFFCIYENPENEYIPSCVIETIDGCYIVSTWDDRGGTSLLIKLSDNGEIINREPVCNNNVMAMIDRMYHNPANPKYYSAVGSLFFLSEHFHKPFVLHFDDDLNLIELYEGDLPETYKVFISERAIMTSDGDFLFATSLGEQNAYHRLYMRLTMDGSLTNFHEATDDCSSARMINDIFEFPGRGRFGEYRTISGHSNYSSEMCLFGFDDSFVFDTLEVYHGLNYQVGDSSYSVKPLTFTNGTVVTFGDSCILLSDRAIEYYHHGNGTASDLSTLLTMTDLEGNVLKHLVVGSFNDTANYPVAFNSIDFMKPNNELIYLGCFGTNSGSFPVNQSNHITISQIDSGFNIRWEKTFTHPLKYLLPSYLLATGDGGCIVVGAAFQKGHYDIFALKINSDGTLGSDEIIVEDIRPYLFHPNPVQDQLHLQYSPDVKPMQVELYDLQGRLVRTQSKDLESLSLQGLSAGTYTMRVTLEDGKVFSDKVVKE